MNNTNQPTTEAYDDQQDYFENREAADKDFEEFEITFGQIKQNADGQFLRDLSDLKIRTTEPCLVWTVLDCDGNLVLAHGLRFINRIGYVITSHPWSKTNPPRDYLY